MITNTKVTDKYIIKNRYFYKHKSYQESLCESERKVEFEILREIIYLD